MEKGKTIRAVPGIYRLKLHHGRLAVILLDEENPLTVLSIFELHHREHNFEKYLYVSSTKCGPESRLDNTFQDFMKNNYLLEENIYIGKNSKPKKREILFRKTEFSIEMEDYELQRINPNINRANRYWFGGDCDVSAARISAWGDCISFEAKTSWKSEIFQLSADDNKDDFFNRLKAFLGYYQKPCHEK